MWRRAKQAKWEYPVIVLFLIGQILFNGPVLISKAAGVTASRTSSSAYWSNCVNLARQQATHPLTREPSALDFLLLDPFSQIWHEAPQRYQHQSPRVSRWPAANEEAKSTAKCGPMVHSPGDQRI